MNADRNERKLRQRESLKRLVNLCLSGICLGLEAGVFAYCWMNHFRYSIIEEVWRQLWFKGNMLEIAIYGAILVFLSSMYGGMRLGYLKNVELIFSQIFATLIANILIYCELSVMATQLFVPDVFITMMFYQTIIVVVYINVANRIYRFIFPPRRLFLVYGDRPAAGIYSKFESRKDKYIITGAIHVSEGFDALCAAILRAYEAGECNAVLLGDISVKDRTPLIKFCYARSIRFYMLPKITDVILMGAEELHVFDSPLLLTREYSLTMEQRWIKRGMDLIFSLILLVIASPIMLLAAIAIKLYDGGPILYKQVRCTVNQKRFNIMKFRSMRTDAEKDGVARLARKNDDRITPIGRFIRKCRIDELPQLFNILKGDMSFIGPRPERPEIIAQYMEVMPEFIYRMKVKAGLAGFAQVYGKYNTSPYDKLKLDLTYIENYSVWLDLKLMLLTLKVLLWPDSTEGIESEQITALREEKQRKQGNEEEE
ncbi:MAG: exopolysaccharide biosynthesis polyprenyl glycosylphosphotransferase [Lachnospiraceae bacterium]|nr:exopolysaccharide biosynthesis polyprenyl glycosylphosphotransferase [uncultured Acetatifactor sp.]MCI8287765.1 exopolysaccharide biosynthesis polyprenyl glycosylphosphotransferase [Lachnospiraceae bacterium]